MSGGVSTLPVIDPSKLLPPSKTGIDFLASSHFSISQHNDGTHSSLKSIFKKDYVPWDISHRPPASVPPFPAEVLHRDARFFNEKASETTNAYPSKSVPRSAQKDTNILRCTNFKMDRDLSKFDSFHTTHSAHYQPPAGGASRHQLSDNPQESFIPQGDPDKAPQPISDYRDRYRGHGVGTPFKAPSMHQGGPSTITGDGRLHHFGTTHNNTFNGSSYPRIHSFPAPVGTNIPQGDKDKETTMQTIMQGSFIQHDPSDLKKYDKGGVMGKLQRTNFKQADGHRTWDTYLSTMEEHYRPVRTGVSRSAPPNHRNHSDFPEGDYDTGRNADRFNLTTNRFYHGSVLTPRPNIVSGADKRTKSNVWFGEPTLDDQFYSTTVDSTFTALDIKPKNTERPDLNTRSAVPVNYYPNEKHNTTTWSDFQNPKQKKMIPNPVGIDELKKSHIDAPLGGVRQFSTEHLDQYTPKRIGRIPIDSGRLQRSTVPLGTLSIAEN